MLTFPITDPITQFLLILLIILFAPIILNKLRIPHLLGMIIAGAVVGEYGFNLLERDSGIILSGTAGLLYIMFLAGLEIDIQDFKKNSFKSIVFGLYTFCIPMFLGTLTGLYILDYSLETSILLASMFSSHTLIAYPIISKYGVTQNRAVNVAVGGTMITDMLAMLVLAAILGMQSGEANADFWLRISLHTAAFILAIVIFFPIIARWFLKTFTDNILQYVFVLAMLFLGAFIAEWAGIEGIIGAFLAGLSMNKLVPKTSPLMNRVEFVGNAIFIPFFLISTGMLINFRAFINGFDTLKVALIITSVAMLAKYLAAVLTQKTFKFTKDEMLIIFSLNSAKVAATLAIVLVGYKAHLFDENVLNGTIIMILITCTVASFVAQKAAKNIARQETTDKPLNEWESGERILIPINRLEATESLVDLSLNIRQRKSKSHFYGLNIIDNSTSSIELEAKAQQIMKRAVRSFAAADYELEPFIRYDINIVNGIMSAVREQKITDLILALHQSKGFSQSFLGNLTGGILEKCNTTTMIYKYVQPIALIKRHLILVPDHAEEELGFPHWLARVWNIARNTGSRLIFYTTPDTFEAIKKMPLSNAPDYYSFVDFSDWNDFFRLSRDIRSDDNIIMVLSRKDRPSYNNVMAKIPAAINKSFQNTSIILIYPMQEGVDNNEQMSLTNPSIREIERSNIGRLFVRIRKWIRKFRKKK
ncbi:MAG: cation:proton antiporter [Prevotellaceae bacterium]|jgi:Kef-type K+ transport system membrane component KefB|nr:cation:proton antiporter [Prevotellaceae bacterium]